jgi:hypothetical protein
VNIVNAIKIIAVQNIVFLIAFVIMSISSGMGYNVLRLGEGGDFDHKC